MVFFKKKFEDSFLSKNLCKFRSKPDVSLLLASREKPAPPLPHTSCLIVSMCVRESRSLRADSALLSFFMLSILGKPDLGDQCRLYKRFGSVQTAVVRLTEADARSLLGLGRLRVGWVNCRIREHVEVARCFRCQGYGHVSRGCALPSRKDACWRCGGASHVTKE